MIPYFYSVTWKVVTLTDLQRLLFYSKKYWRYLVLSIAAASFYGLFSAAPVRALKYLIDKIFIGGKQHLIIPFILFLIVLFALKGVFAFASLFYMRWVGNRVVNDIRTDLFNKIVYFPLSFFKKKTTGELMSHFLNDIAMIENASSLAVKNGVRSLFEAIALILVALFQNWKLAALSLLVAPFIIFSIQRIGKAAKAASRAIQVEVGSLSSALQEVFVGIREVKIANGEEIEKSRFRKKLKNYFSSIMRNVKVEAFGPAFIETIGMLGGGFVFYVAAMQVLNGVITPGQLTSFFAAILLSYQPIKRLINAYTSIQFGLAAANRIFAVIDIDYPALKDRTIEISSFQKEIRFDNVSFWYNEGDPVLKNVNLVIKKGERIGLLGPSGSGKSTMCDLLLGFLVPSEGQILIDGIDITKITHKSLRSLFGSVSQQTFLFNDTILANVTYGSKKDIDDDFSKIIDACKRAYAHQFIEESSDGYSTVVGENGNLLSGGQKQRLTIARALLKKSQILIFDEATSSLDQESENMIRLAIEGIKTDKVSPSAEASPFMSDENAPTLLIVSHRLSLIQKMDRVFGIEHGQLVEKRDFFVSSRESSVQSL